MIQSSFDLVRRWALLLCLAPVLSARAAEFVELTVEIQCCDWDYRFFSDRNRKDAPEASAPGLFTESQTRRCVIGIDTWMMESTFPSSKDTVWFTGTNIVEHTLITKATADEAARKLSQTSKLAITSPPAGHRFTRIHESVDGNPGRPGGVADLMPFNLPNHISWLAFCSAPSLKNKGRRIFPPSDLWKESAIFYSGWSDSTHVFPDPLGLPRRIDLVSTSGQPILQYQVRQSTNIFGWQIPTEFYGVQYQPTRTNLWKLHLTFEGRVTSIHPSAPPEIPAVVMQAVQR